MAALTRWVLSHKLYVVIFWLTLALVGGATSQKAVNALSQRFDLPGSEAFATNRTIVNTYGNGADVFPIVPIVTLPPGTTVRSPGVRAGLRAAFARVTAALPRTRVVSYGDTGSGAFVSPSGRTTFGLIYLPQLFQQSQSLAYQDVITHALKSATVGGAHFHVTGLDVLAASSSGGGGDQSLLAEVLIGGFGALLVLIFVFRSFMALIPLIMAVVSIPTTFLLVWGLTGLTEINFIVQYLVALIGLGVAIDYSLIIVLRWRGERARGLGNEEAVVRAMATAGRAVVFSGTTVAIGLLALIVLSVPFLRSMGIGGMLIPLVSVAVALTLLPVVLASAGPKIDWPRFAAGSKEGAFWHRWAEIVSRRHWIAAVIDALVLAALVAETTTLALGQSKADALAKSGDAYQGLHALENAGFPVGVLAPFEVLVGSPSAAGPGGDLGAIARRLDGVDGVWGAVAPGGPEWRRDGTALVAVLPKDDASSGAGRATVDRVRQAAKRLPGNIQVGGSGPLTTDFIAAVYGNFPLMIFLIAVTTFLLLVRAFRSLILPLQAVALNALSVAAAWGVIVFVWQYGYGSKLIWGIQSTGAITFWVPLLVFAFLFGLSMDYEVFILSRMREEFDRQRSTDGAVVSGIGRTGRLVTSAALILFFAFVALSSTPETDIKVLATGLGAGILLDATVIRMLLVPALVSILGRWNWWLPALPARLLRVQRSSLVPPDGQ